MAMSAEQMMELRPGDVIRNEGDASSVMVVLNDGRTIVAARYVTITNPLEWILVRSAK